MVSSGGYQNVYGTATNVAVNAAGVQIVFSGGITSGTILSGNGNTFPTVPAFQEVYAGATASGTIIVKKETAPCRL